LIEKAHSLGLKVIQDQVANHVGSRHPWVQDPPLENWFHGTVGHHELNKFKNSVLLSPHANKDELSNVLDGWFSDDLPDVNQDEPEVARYEIQNALWWVGVTGIDGIRQDTIQYMPRPFIRDLSATLHHQYPKMWMVGEVFERSEPAQTAFLSAVTPAGTESTPSWIQSSTSRFGIHPNLCSQTNSRFGRFVIN
jgi:glycosidase